MSISISYDKSSIVAFLDVLGFRSILREKSRVEEYFSATIQSIDALDKSELKAILISDSVVLKIPLSDIESLRNMCVAVAKIQAGLAVKNIWLRGGITIGEIDFQNHNGFQIVVGDALARSYELETKFAKFPRVLIDPMVMKVLNLSRVQLLDGIKRDRDSVIPQPIFDVRDRMALIPGSTIEADGMWINYAYPILSEEVKLRKVLGHLKERLYEGQGHYEKYRWVQSYFAHAFGSEFMAKYGRNYESLRELIFSL